MPAAGCGRGAARSNLRAMSEAPELVLRGGHVALPWGLTQTDVGVREGRIVTIGDVPKGAREIDCRHLHVLPGLIDTQVHFREPGLEHKEDLRTGTAGAALGGITAVFEMPNTKPNTDTAERLADKVARGRAKAHTDFAFFIGATTGNADHLGELERLEGCSGVKIFMGSSTGTLLVAEDDAIEAVLRNGRRRVAVHCEDEKRLIERKPRAAEGEPGTHHVWRDQQTAIRATERLLALAKRTGRPVHVLHVTTATEARRLAESKHLATMEVTPQHLLLHAPDCYERLGTHAQMNPPIREKEHSEALWAALRVGVVDVIGSDHAPHTLDEKAKTYPASPSGLPGVQTTVPLLLDAVHRGQLPLMRLVDLLAHGPQRIYDILGKGRIAVGWDADFTIVDLAKKRTIERSWIASRCGWSPFEGREVVGWPVRTVVRGHDAMVDDELQSIDAQPVRFVGTQRGDA